MSWGNEMGDYPIQQLYHRGLLTDIDTQFADLMVRLSGDGLCFVLSSY